MTVVRKVNGKKKKVKIFRPAPKSPTEPPTTTPTEMPPPQAQIAVDAAPTLFRPLFDDNLHPKPAHYDVLDVLKSPPPAAP